jgi:hypothetical protein
VTTPRKSPDPGAEPALAWSEHLARLLQHADQLLREWEAASRKAAELTRAQVGAARDEAMVELRRAVAGELEAVRRELRKQGAAPRGRNAAWFVPAMVFANLVLAAGVLVAVLTTRPGAPPAEPKAVVTPGPAADLAPDAGVPEKLAPAPAPPPPCAGLLRGRPAPRPEDLVAACAAVHCPKGATVFFTEASIGRCLGASADPLAQKLRAAAKKKKLRCTSPPGDAASGYDVEPAWLDECLRP